MPAVALSGADGLLGLHIRCAAHTVGIETRSIVLGSAYDQEAVAATISGATDYLHLVTIPGTSETWDAPALAGRQVAEALAAAGQPPRVVTRVETAPWGVPPWPDTGDDRDILAKAAADIGAEFHEVHLPYVFGEFGSPAEDPLVAGTMWSTNTSLPPADAGDTTITVMHAQDAADTLLNLATAPAVHRTSTHELRETIARIDDADRNGDIPAITEPLEGRLYATYLAAALGDRATRTYPAHTDERGTLIEAFRMRGGAGQVNLLTTVPGHVRSAHMHRRKIEILAPIRGRMAVTIRRMYADSTMTLVVDGTESAAIIVPPLTVHEVRSTGTEPLVLAYWSDRLHDPANPDTYPPEVAA